MGTMFSAASADANTDDVNKSPGAGNDTEPTVDPAAGAGNDTEPAIEPAADPSQSGGEPRVTIDIFGSEKKNSKGFLINDIKITPQNINSTFSSKDQVEHFLENVFGYVRNSNLPKDEQEPTTNFFHSYKENISLKPIPAMGGSKKKRSRKHKLKDRHRKTKKH